MFRCIVDSDLLMKKKKLWGKGKYKLEGEGHIWLFE